MSICCNCLQSGVFVWKQHQVIDRVSDNTLSLSFHSTFITSKDIYICYNGAKVAVMILYFYLLVMCISVKICNEEFVCFIPASYPVQVLNSRTKIQRLACSRNDMHFITNRPTSSITQLCMEEEMYKCKTKKRHENLKVWII